MPPHSCSQSSFAGYAGASTGSLQEKGRRREGDKCGRRVFCDYSGVGAMELVTLGESVVLRDRALRISACCPHLALNILPPLLITLVPFEVVLG